MRYVSVLCSFGGLRKRSAWRFEDEKEAEGELGSALLFSLGARPRFWSDFRDHFELEGVEERMK